MNNPRSIAIIAGQLVVGGAERQLFLWLSNMDKTLYKPVVFTLHPGHGDFYEKEIEDLDIPLIRIPQKWNRISRLQKIIQSMRPFKPELIHGWHLFAGTYAGIAAKTIGARSIAGVRNAYESLKDHQLELIITSLTVDAYVTNSKSTANQLKALFQRSRKPVYSVQNATEDRFIAREEIRDFLMRTYGLREDEFWIASMGRMDPLKRFDLLVQVIANLDETGKEIKLVLIGDGPEMDNLKQKAHDLKIDDRVIFTGEVANANTWLKAFDLFLFTSIDEGMPNVIMEAAAAGLPIVTWRLPFYQELLEDQKHALLVESMNMKGMAMAVTELIDSPELRTRIGLAAQEHINNSFSLDRYISRMSAVYEEVLRSDWDYSRK